MAQPLQNGVPVHGNVAQGQWDHYYIDIPPGGSQLTVVLDQLTGDNDLYTKLGSQPTSSSYDCRPYAGGTTSETCTHNVSPGQRWYISVHGYSGGSYRLTATIQITSTPVHERWTCRSDLHATDLARWRLRSDLAFRTSGRFLALTEIISYRHRWAGKTLLLLQNQLRWGGVSLLLTLSRAHWLPASWLIENPRWTPSSGILIASRHRFAAFGLFSNPRRWSSLTHLIGTWRHRWPAETTLRAFGPNHHRWTIGRRALFRFSCSCGYTTPSSARWRPASSLYGGELIRWRVLAVIVAREVVAIEAPQVHIFGRAKLKPVSLTLQASLARTSWEATMRFLGQAPVSVGEAIEIHVGDTRFRLLVDRYRIERRGLDREMTVSALSPVSSVAMREVEGKLEGAASQVVESLVGPVTWRIVDFPVTLEARGSDALALAQRIVSAPGGVLLSLPDGSLVARDPYPKAPPIPIDPEITTELAIERRRHAIENLITIIGARSEQRDTLEYDREAGEIVAHPEPFRPLLLECTRTAVSIGSPRIVERVIEETLSLRAGQNSARFPIHELLELTFLDRPTGVTIAPGYRTIEAEDYALVRIKYRTREIRWPVSPGGVGIAMFLLIDPNDGAVEIEAIRGDQVLGEREIPDPLITTLPAAVSRARVELEETAQPTVRATVSLAGFHRFDPADRVLLPDARLGWITSVRHDIRFGRTTTTLEVLSHAESA